MSEYLLLPFVEFEIRLGTLSKTFDNGLDKKYFNIIKENLIAKRNYFKTIETKTTTELINKNLKYDLEKNTLLMKENVLNKTFSLSSSPFDIKLSINQEFNLNSYAPSFNKNTICITRKKERTSFIHPDFRYDLTIVNETINNITREKYEIEIELLVNNETLMWSTDYINDFIECKIYDLVKIVEPIEREKFKIKLFV